MPAAALRVTIFYLHSESNLISVIAHRIVIGIGHRRAGGASRIRMGPWLRPQAHAVKRHPEPDPIGVRRGEGAGRGARRAAPRPRPRGPRRPMGGPRCPRPRRGERGGARRPTGRGRPPYALPCTPPPARRDLRSAGAARSPERPERRLITRGRWGYTVRASGNLGGPLPHAVCSATDC